VPCSRSSNNYGSAGSGIGSTYLGRGGYLIGFLMTGGGGGGKVDGGGGGGGRGGAGGQDW
jgi:hypothetical protein